MNPDVVIVGAGPAGLTAGIYSVRRGLKTVVYERGVVGGTMNHAKDIENWPGDKHVSGGGLSKRMGEHARSLGVEIQYNEVKQIQVKPEGFEILLRDKVIECKAVIIASGGVKHKVKVKGEQEYAGKGVSYCATCDGPFFKDKAVAVVGQGNMAVEDAIYLAENTSKTYLVAKELLAEKTLIEKLNSSNVELVSDNLKEVSGSEYVEKIKTADGKEYPVEGVFISLGSTASTELAEKAGVELDDKGFIKVNRSMETNVKGIYAAGDVTGGIPQIAVAAGEGAVAALKAYEHVKN